MYSIKEYSMNPSTTKKLAALISWMSPAQLQTEHNHRPPAIDTHNSLTLTWRYILAGLKREQKVASPCCISLCSQRYYSGVYCIQYRNDFLYGFYLFERTKL